MFLASNKKQRGNFISVGFFLFACFFALQISAWAVNTGSVSVVASGKSLSEAMKVALRQAATNNFSKNKSIDKNLLQSVLEQEVYNTPSQYISSYKIIDGGSGSFVNISATVEVAAIEALLALVPNKFTDVDEEAKVFLMVKSMGISDPLVDASVTKSMTSVVQEKITRRGFSLLNAADIPDSMPTVDDVSSQEILKAFGDKFSAAISIGVKMRFQTIENESNHNMEDRLFISGTILSNKSNQVLHHINSSILLPKLAKKEAAPAEFAKVIAEDGAEIFQTMLVKAGEKFLQSTLQKEGFILRISHGPSFSAVSKFRMAVEGINDVKSILESNIRRGEYDFQIQTALTKDALRKKIMALNVEGLGIIPVKENESPMIIFELKEKTIEPQAISKERN